MVGVLVAIATGVTVVVKVLKSFLVKYLTHAIILSIQFAFTTTSIALVVSFVFLSITALVTLYNQIQTLLDYITSANIGPLECFFNVLGCSGALDAINNGVIMIYSVITSVALFHLLKFLIYGIKFIGNELFKLGVLLGQAVN